MAVVIHNSAKSAAFASSAGGTATLGLNIRNVPDRFLLVAVAYRSTGGAASVTWRNQTSGSGDQSLTKLGGIPHNGGQNLNIELWGLVAPTTTTDTGAQVRVTNGGATSGQCVIFAVCYTGASQTNPYDGYPGASTAITDQANAPRAASVQGTTNASGLTTALAMTTSTLNDVVINAIALDVGAAVAGTNFKHTGADGFDRLQMGTTSGSTGLAIRGGLAEARSATSASLQWTTYVGASNTNFNVVQSGRNYVQCAFVLLAAPSSNPYYVEMPSEPVAFGSSALINARFVSIADFPTAGSMYRHASGSLIGPTEVGTVTSSYAWQYTARNATTFTAVGVGTGATPMFDLFRLNPGRGNGGGDTLTMFVPAGVQENDIMLVSVYTEPNTITPTQASFTQINTQTTANMRQTNFWKRMLNADGDITVAGTKTYSFTMTGASWRSIGVAFYRGCTTSRTPYINATDDAGDTALPVANTGSSTTPTTNTGSMVTSAAGQTIVTFVNAFEGNGTNSPAIDGMEEREDFYNVHILDKPITASGTTVGDQNTVRSSTGTWATYTIALIPASTVTNHTRTVSTDPPAISSTAVRVVAYKRTSATDPPTISSTAVRRLAILRTAATDPPSPTSTADAILGYRRTALTDPQPISSTASRRVAYLRTAITPIVVAALKYNDASPPPVLVVDSPTITNHPLLVRTPHLSTPTALTPSALAVRVVAYTRTAATDPPSVSAVAFRRMITRRTVSTDPPAISSVAVRVVAYRRTATTPATAGALTPSVILPIIQVQNPLSAGWVDYGLYPVYVSIDDISGTYPGCTFLLEAQMLSATAGQKVYARLYNVTDSTFVAGSQIETSAPHTTSQIVRSPALGLVSGKVYKAQFNKGSAAQMVGVHADVVVRDVA